MATKYARGHAAWGECQRCGKKDFLQALIMDGQFPNLRVCRECYEPKHPQENLVKLDDPVALWRPAPENLPAPSAPVLSADDADIYRVTELDEARETEAGELRILE